MLNIKKVSDNRLDIDLAGELDAVAMRVALDSLLEQSKDVKNGQMLYRIADFAMPTLGAIGVEMGYLPSLFGLLGKYDKCAVLCDAAWVRNAAEIEGRLFPGIEIKSFKMDEEVSAEAWLAGEETDDDEDDDISVPV